MMAATSGDQWTGVFSQLNSGTYNSQWVVVDGKLVAKSEQRAAGADYPEGTLWVLEQIPTYVWRADMSSALSRQSYWPSYNIPYNQKVFDMSGYPAQAAKDPEYGYNTTSRAAIMARNHTTTRNLEDVMALARYNDYQHDPLAQDNPVMGAVAARGDLQAGTSATPFGAIDSKAISAGELGATGNAILRFISGPTTAQQEPFSFTPKFSGVVRDGVPDRWDFDWVAFPLKTQSLA